METRNILPSILGKSKNRDLGSDYISYENNLPILFEEERNKYAEIQATAFIKSLHEKYKQQRTNILEDSYLVGNERTKLYDSSLINQRDSFKHKTSIKNYTDSMIQTLFDFVINLKNNIHKDIFIDIGKLLVKTKEDCKKWSIFIFGGKSYLNSEEKYEIDTSYWTSKNMDLPLERVNKMLDEHNIILENRANINRPFYVNLWALKKT